MEQKTLSNTESATHSSGVESDWVSDVNGEFTVCAYFFNICSIKHYSLRLCLLAIATKSVCVCGGEGGVILGFSNPSSPHALGIVILEKRGA